MQNLKIIKCGSIQIIQLPKALQITLKNFEIRKKPLNLIRAFELLTQLPHDFFIDNRKDSPPQKRNF